MSDPNACDTERAPSRWTLRGSWIGVFALASALSAPAHAEDQPQDSKAACGAAYEETQVLREAGKLVSAREQAALCSSELCAEFVRNDCTAWFSDIDKRIPTVVFDVRVGGERASDAKVSVDGQLWADALNGRAKPLDPGEHVVEVELGGVQHSRKIVVQEGEKGQRIDITITSNAAQSTGGPSFGAGPWVVGSFGVAGLLVGAITGGLVVQQKSVTSEHCDDVALTCDDEGLAAADLGRELGPVTTAALVLGGLGVAASAAWFIAVSMADTKPAKVGVLVRPGFTGIEASVTW